MERVLLTVEEAAHSLGVGRSYLYPLLMRGELASVKLGRSRRIPVDALKALVQRLQDEQAEEVVP